LKPAAPALSSGIIPVRRGDETYEYLLLRCYRNWDFPKGSVDPGEDPEAAAARELKEEAGIETFTWLAHRAYHETGVYGRHKVARYYLAQVPLEAAVKILPNPVTGIIEHHGFRWCKYAEARELLVPRLQAALDWAQRLLEA
jgi:bis(5'-nucleosidyl)-tetraphosphatase